MCLIIVSKTPIGRDIYDEALIQNEDGLGLMYAYKGDLVLRKSFDKEDIWEEYNWCMEKELQAVIHFRFATKGVINLENCHPFRLNKEVAMMHNGSLNIPIYNQLMSDTWHYAKYLSHLAWHQVDALEKEVGINRLVFINREGRVKILNKNMGQWNKTKTNWYSNSKVLEKLFPIAYGKTIPNYGMENFHSPGVLGKYSGIKSYIKTETINTPLPTQQRLEEALIKGTPYTD